MVTFKFRVQIAEVPYLQMLTDNRNGLFPSIIIHQNFCKEEGPIAKRRMALVTLEMLKINKSSSRA